MTGVDQGHSGADPWLVTLSGAVTLAVSSLEIGKVDQGAAGAAAWPVSLASVPTHGVTVADGGDVTQGALADAAVVGDNTGSVSAKLRGVNKALAGTLTVQFVSAQAVTVSTLTDDVGVTTAASESAASRLAVTAALRLLDTTAGVGAQLVAAKGDLTSGQWVNVKAVPANLTINNVQWNGNTVDTNSGGKSAGTLRVVLATDQPNLTTPLNVQGDVADAAADSGSPVKQGGLYSTAPPTYTTGQRATAMFDSRGAQRVTLYAGDTINKITAGTPGDGTTNTQTVLSTGTLMLAYNGASWDRLRVANVYKSITDAALTAGTGATVWTPASGKKFRLMGWSLSLSVAGQIIFGDNLVATVIHKTEKLAAAGISQVAFNYGNGFLSAAANNVLKIDVSANGNVGGYVFGTEE